LFTAKSLPFVTSYVQDICHKLRAGHRSRFVWNVGSVRRVSCLYTHCCHLANKISGSSRKNLVKPAGRNQAVPVSRGTKMATVCTNKCCVSVYCARFIIRFQSQCLWCGITKAKCNSLSFTEQRSSGSLAVQVAQSFAFEPH
jgi:hypothetical protein